MASLLSAAQKASFEKAMANLFDTFSQDVIIYKEARIEITNINQPRMYGYNERSDIDNINYIPVTGVFPALVTFTKKQSQQRLEEADNIIDKGEVEMKVKSDANDFIQNGKTLYASLDGLMFKFISSQAPRPYISSEFFTYYLERER
jgi:CRISPR-associated protein Cas8b1/Cst1 subtype I-B